MMLLDRWNNFWFAKAPYFDLAFIRLLMVALQLFIMIKAYGKFTGTVDLPDEAFLPLPALKVLMLPWGWGVRPDHLMVLTVYWATVVVGVTAFIGLLTNSSLFLFALGSLFLQGLEYSFGEQHHGDAIMMIALLVFSFAPCGKVLSVDSYIKGIRSRGNAEVRLLDYGSSFAGWPIKLMMCVFAMIYLSAIFSKMLHGGEGASLDWINGITLQYYLVQDGLRWDIDLGLWLAQFHVFIFILQIFVVFFQSTFSLIIFFPKLRWIYLPIGLLFHIGIYLTMRAPFPQWMILYSLFVPWSLVFQWLATKSIAVTEEPERQVN